MPTFYYQALDANERKASGELEAETLAQALSALEAQGLTIQSIGAAPLSAAVGSAPLSAAVGSAPLSAAVGESPFAAPLSAAEVERRLQAQRASLQRQLASVMERAQKLLPALQAYLEEMPSGHRRREFAAALKVLESGDAVQATEALGVLPAYWIPLFAAASCSSDPGRILCEFVEESERANELMRQWWRALAYPALLGGLAISVLTVLSIFVIPLFREIFRDFELNLPPLTLAILEIAEWIASGKILFVVAAIAALLGLLRLARRLLPRSTRQWWGDRLTLPSRRTTAAARFCQFTADLLEAGLETPQAIRLAGAATGKAPLVRATERVASVIERQGVAAKAGGQRSLTNAVVFALGHGMPRRSRIRLLREIGVVHADRARRRMSWTHGIVEPLAICTIGLVVGIVVLALFLPLFGLIQGLS